MNTNTVDDNQLKWIFLWNAPNGGFFTICADDKGTIEKKRISDFDALQSMWNKWKSALSDDISQFEYSMWSRKKQKTQRLILGSSCLFIMILFIGLMMVAMAKKNFQLERTDLVLYLISLVVPIAIGTFGTMVILRAQKYVAKIIFRDDHNIEICYSDKNSISRTLSDIKHIELDNFRNSWISFSQGPKVFNLERFSFWPILKERLSYKTQKE